MNPAVLLALITDLYQQVLALRIEVEKLQAENDESAAGST